MTKYDRHVQAAYDARWREEGEHEYLSYPRNQLLARWLKDVDGAGRSMLDVACGNGAVAGMFQRLGFRVSGIEISEAGVAQAAARVPGDFRQGSVEESFPFPDASFDVVFWGDNVEHLLRPVATLREIRRVLRPGGDLYLSTPNVGYWKFRLIYVLRGSMPRTEGAVNPPWEWEHLRFFTPSILREFLRSEGFATLAIEGVGASRVSALARRWPTLFGPILLAHARRPT